MKINLGVSSDDGNFLWKLLNEKWRQDLKGNLDLIRDGAVEALRPLEKQLKLVLEKERLKGEIAFRCWLKYEDAVKLYIQTYFWPLKIGHWFILSDSFNTHFPLFSFNTKEMISRDMLKDFAFSRVNSSVNQILSKKLECAVYEFKKFLSANDPSLTSNFFVERP